MCYREYKNNWSTHKRNVITACLVMSMAAYFVLEIREANGWTPPIGIPEPEFGIEETVESVYGDPDYRTKTVSGGGDLEAKMPSLSPGDVLVIESGTYRHRGSRTWNHQGTASQPIFVRGASSTNKPVIKIGADGDNIRLGGSYVIYENLDFDISAGEDLGVSFSGNHVSLRNSEVRDGVGKTHTALYIGGTYNVAYNNKIHDNGNLGGSGDIDFHGMGASGHHNWIVDNEIYRNAGDGMQINAGNASNKHNVHHIYVGRNNAYQNQQAGFWIKFCIDIILSENQSHGHRSSDSSSGQGMGFQYGTERAWFLYNNIYDNEEGILIASDGGPGGNGGGQDGYFIGNVIHNIQREGLVSWESSSRKHVVNNTIYDANIGLDFFNARSGTEIVNNLFAGIQGKDMVLDSNKGGTFAYNFCEGGSCSMSEASCKNCSSGNPRFRDINGPDNVEGNADDDFRLQSDSDAMDRGTVSNIYQTYQSLYGISIARDRAGAGRPQGSGWDAGAYEYGSSSPPPPPPSTPPSAPGLLRIERP